MDQPLRVLLLEDNPDDAQLVERELIKSGFSLVTKRVETREEFLSALSEFNPDILIADFSLPQFDALSALRLLKVNDSDLPVILVTGSQSEEMAAACIKAGAFDYILKS
ncbi:MAG: response regulator, partial [bacterium]